MKALIKKHTLLSIVATGNIDDITSNDNMPDEVKKLSIDLVTTAPLYDICTESTQDNNYQVSQSWKNGSVYFVIKRRQEIQEHTYEINSISDEVAKFRKKHNTDKIFHRQASKKEIEKGVIAHICDDHGNHYASILDELAEKTNQIIKEL